MSVPPEITVEHGAGFVRVHIAGIEIEVGRAEFDGGTGMYIHLQQNAELHLTAHDYGMPGLSFCVPPKETWTWERAKRGELRDTPWRNRRLRTTEGPPARDANPARDRRERG